MPRDQYVASNACLTCGPGMTRAAGDDASGPDTSCAPVDACAAALGVSCSTFEQGYLKASNRDEGDRFGHSVALEGDTLAVGAYWESSNTVGANGNQADNSAPGSGAVYVFTRSGTTWTQAAYLKASNPETYDFFGVSVALAGGTLAVGASGESSSARGVNGNQDDNSASRSGAVYVFTRSGTTWAKTAYLKASNSGIDDLFGSRIALAGDVLAVGASGEDSNARGVNGNQTDNSAPGSGAVYVFTRSGTTWTQAAYLKTSNTDMGDSFGESLALSGDTLAIGTPYERSNAIGVDGNQADNSAPASGAVYVFTRSGTTWTQGAYLKASNTETSDFFGVSVALDGDTLAVGASGEASGVNGNQDDNSAPASGAVYVFTRSGTTWTQAAYLKASNVATSDRFGASVALTGELLAVGAPDEDGRAAGLNGNQADNGATNSGAVYLFRRSATAWTQTAYLKASNTGADDQFGTRVFLDGHTLAVGVPKEDGSASGVNGPQVIDGVTDSGAVYVRIIAP